jgi:hypothetical protein
LICPNLVTSPNEGARISQYAVSKKTEPLVRDKCPAHLTQASP